MVRATRFSAPGSAPVPLPRPEGRQWQKCLELEVPDDKQGCVPSPTTDNHLQTLEIVAYPGEVTIASSTGCDGGLVALVEVKTVSFNGSHISVRPSELVGVSVNI